MFLIICASWAVSIAIGEKLNFAEKLSKRSARNLQLGTLSENRIYKAPSRIPEETIFVSASQNACVLPKRAKPS